MVQIVRTFQALHISYYNLQINIISSYGRTSLVYTIFYKVNNICHQTFSLIHRSLSTKRKNREILKLRISK